MKKVRFLTVVLAAMLQCLMCTPSYSQKVNEIVGTEEVMDWVTFDDYDALLDSDGLLYVLNEGKQGYASVVGISEDFDGSSVVIPDQILYESVKYSVDNIVDYAFYMSEIESIDLGSVIYIGRYAFFNSEDLTEVTGMQKVCTLGWSSFFGTAIKTADLSSVRSIGDYSFTNCADLESITIGRYVKQLGHGTFKSCSSLKSVTLLGSGALRYEPVDTPDEASMYGEDNTKTFEDDMSGTTLYVLEGFLIDNSAFAGYGFDVVIDPDSELAGIKALYAEAQQRISAIDAERLKNYEDLQQALVLNAVLLEKASKCEEELQHQLSVEILSDFEYSEFLTQGFSGSFNLEGKRLSYAGTVESLQKGTYLIQTFSGKVIKYVKE